MEKPHLTGRRFLGCGAEVVECNYVEWIDPEHMSPQLRRALRSLWSQVGATKDVNFRDKIRQRTEISDKAHDDAKQFVKERNEEDREVYMQMLKVTALLRDVSFGLHQDFSDEE